MTRCTTGILIGLSLFLSAPSESQLCDYVGITTDPSPAPADLDFELTLEMFASCASLEEVTIGDGGPSQPGDVVRLEVDCSCLIGVPPGPGTWFLSSPVGPLEAGTYPVEVVEDSAPGSVIGTDTLTVVGGVVSVPTLDRWFLGLCVVGLLGVATLVLRRRATAESSSGHSMTGLLLAAALGLAPGIEAQPLLFGYTGVQGPGALEFLDAHDLRTNVGSLIYHQHNFDQEPSFTELHLQRFGSRGLLAGVSVAGFLFERVPTAGSACDHGQGPFTSRLRADWHDRLLIWFSRHGKQLSPADTAWVISHEEVNNECTDLVEVELLGQSLRGLFPDMPLAMGWGATQVKNGPTAQPPPGWIPEVFDLLGLWSYGIYDPLDRGHPKNANRDFFDPEDPANPGTAYGDLFSRLLPHQQVVLVFEAHYQHLEQGVHTILGWSPSDLADLAQNYLSFAEGRPEILALYGFHFGNGPRFIGLRDLVAGPGTNGVRLLEAHQTIGCKITGSCGVVDR